MKVVGLIILAVGVILTLIWRHTYVATYVRMVVMVVIRIYYFNHLILTFLSPVTTTFCFASGRGCCHDSYVTFIFFTSVRKLDYKEN